MKKLRRITAVILAMVMVLSTMTNVFAAKNDKKLNFDPYNYVSIAIKDEGKKVWAYQSISYDMDNRADKELWSTSILGSGVKYTWDDTYGNVVTTAKNTPKIKENTRFKLVGWYTTGEPFTYIIENGEDSFYQYCYDNYNPNKKSKTFNIVYTVATEPVEENLYTVTYTAEDGVTGLPIDTNEYNKGTEVEISKEIPVREGYRFNGWLLNDTPVGEKITVEASDIVLKADWVKQYKVTYYVDNSVVNTTEVDEGTNVSNYDEYKYTNIPVDKNISEWTVEPKDANLEAIDKDIVVSATTSTKMFTVVYNLNGNEYKKIEKVPYGTKTLELLGSPAKESEDFSGWVVESGDIKNVTSDVVISGSTSIKKFTVTYKVDGVIKKSFENVEYGKDLPKYNYTPDEGYDFSGWDNLPEKVTDNLVIEGTTSIKKFVVTFKFDNGQEDLSVEYSYGDKVETPVKPKKDDKRTENGTDAASWIKYTFAKWVAQGDYEITDLFSVTQNMTFKATYNEKPVEVYFFVLNRGVAQKAEPGNYSSEDYSKGVKGTLKSFTAVDNDDEKVTQMIHTAPSADAFKDIELKEGETIKWYVIKSINNGEKWHVDGIIVGQQYDLVVNYVDVETNEPIMESTVTSVAATSEYNVELPEIKGYELVENTTVSGVMPYDNVETTVKYQKKTYTVTYKVGEDFSKKFTVKYGEPTPVCTYIAPEGYDFLGWGPSTATVQSDLVIEGKIQKKKFTVTYKVAGDDRVKDFSEVFTAEYGDETPTSTYKVPEGYDFLGWGLSTSTVKSNLTIEGKIQKKTFTVIYKVNGEVVDEFTRKYGDPTPASTYVVPEGYDFSGWGFSTATVKSNLVFEAKSTIKTFTVTYKVDGETVAEIPVEYGDDVPAYEYEVAEGYEFSGFELVTEVEDATVVKQNMVFEGTTNEIVVEEEEDIELDTPFAPGVGGNDADDEEEEDITLDTPFASGTKGTANNNNVDADEEEDIDLATPFSSGVKTGDASNYTTYIAVLLIAAVGAMVVAYNKKKALN